MATATDFKDPRRWLILGVLAVSQLMVVLDATVVNIALPSAQEALGFSNGDRQWIITAYALAFGSLLLLGGRIGDIFGRRKVFIFGLSGFAVASAVGGAAPNFETLVGARAGQGLFAALLAPAALSLVTTTFTDPKERTRAFAIWGGIAAGGAAVGLLLGGVLTQYLSWRWTMYVNLAFAIPTALAAWRVLAPDAKTKRYALDLPGAATVTSGVFAVVLGFSQAETRGWSSPVTIGLLVAGVALLAAFIGVERRSDHPMLPLRILADRNRSGSFAALALSGAGMFGVFLFLTYYLQQSLGYSPVKTGLAFLTLALAVGVGVSLASALDRLGPRALVTGGMVITGLAMVFFTRLGLDSSYWLDVAPGFIAFGIGMGLVLAPATDIATRGVVPEDAGAASGLTNTSQQVGGSMGTALLNTLFASAVASSLVDSGASSTAAADAAIDGYHTAFWWSAAFFAAGALISVLVMTSRDQVAETEPDAVQIAETETEPDAVRVLAL